MKADKRKMKGVITEMRKLYSDYQNLIEYHQMKALSHIPESDKVKGRIESRKDENKLLESHFLSDDKNKDEENNLEFVTADKLI